MSWGWKWRQIEWERGMHEYIKSIITLGNDKSWLAWLPSRAPQDAYRCTCIIGRTSLASDYCHGQELTSTGIVSLTIVSLLATLKQWIQDPELCTSLKMPHQNVVLKISKREQQGHRVCQLCGLTCRSIDKTIVYEWMDACVENRFISRLNRTVQFLLILNKINMVKC